MFFFRYHGPSKRNQLGLGLYRIFYWVFKRCSPLVDEVLLFLSSFTGFYWVLLGFTEFYRVLLGFTEFYWVLLGFKRCSLLVDEVMLCATKLI